jgi:hypothetical protein
MHTLGEQGFSVAVHLEEMPLSSEPEQSPRARNLALAAVAGQAGVSTVVLVIIALLLGLWLDSVFGVKGPFTIGLLVLSVPLSLGVMLRIALSATKAIQPPHPKNTPTTTKED